MFIGLRGGRAEKRQIVRTDARCSGMEYVATRESDDHASASVSTPEGSLDRVIGEREALRRRLIEQTAALCKARGYRRIALYGAGRHTLPLVRQPWQWHDVRVMAILDDNPSIDSLRGVPVIRPVDLPVRVPGAGGRAGIDAVVISSDVHEGAMAEACARHAALDGIPVVRIYGDTHPMRESPASLRARLVEAWGVSDADAAWLVENRDERHDATLPMLPPERTELHLRRYEFAARLAGGARVIDAACGTGYGSHLLRTQGGAAQVVGVDLDRMAIDYATRRFGVDGVSFRAASATATGLPDASFDLATSFETVEHVVDAAGLLDEFWRLLRPGGTLVLSTPNDTGLTKHHVHSFTRESLEALVARRFGETEWYGQWADAAPTMDRPAAGIRPLGECERPGYFIVVARRT